MSGMDRLTDENLEQLAQYPGVIAAMAHELLAHRRASQAAPAPSDGLREENERLRAALKTANGALGDIADGEPEFSDEGELVWCRNRAANAWRITRAALTPAPAQEGGE